MNDSLTRKFCESRYRWPIVATATLLLALAAVLPQVDDYFDKRISRNELAENLGRARQTASTLPQYEKRVAEVAERLEALEVRTVDEQRLAQFRNRVMDVVRDAGCQVRQLEVGAPTTRPWKQGDDPLATSTESTASAGDTPFSLESRTMTLTVDGSMAAIHDLLARLEKEQTLSHPRRVQLQAASAEGETVTLELELWLFALSRGKA
jgi:hypothetical protein